MARQGGRDVRRRRGLAEIGVVAAIQSILAVIATYPLVALLGAAIPGIGDALQNYWDLWWVGRAVSVGNLFPFETTYLYFPRGVSLAYHPLMPLNGWVAWLLQHGLAVNLPVAYSLMTLGSFIATGLATYLLLRSLSITPTAAAAGSIVFTYAPIRMSRLVFGNLNLYSTEFIPLAALFAVRLVQTQQRRYAVLAAAMVGLTVWLDLYLALGSALLVALIVLLGLPWRGKGRASARLALEAALLLAGVTLVVASPVLWPMARDAALFRDQADQQQASIENSADLLGFVVPDNMTEPLVKRVVPGAAAFIESVYGSFQGNDAEKNVFLGYTVIALVVVALLMARSPDLWRWLVIAVIFFVLSLGPQLHVGGAVVFDHLPYDLMSGAPLIGFGRSPDRFALFLMLALAVVVGYGLSALEARRPAFQWLSAAVGALVFVEFLVAPIPMDDRVASVPAYYATLPPASGEVGILDIPIDLYGAAGPGDHYMLYQTMHGQPIVGGYIARTPSAALWPLDRPFLRALRVRIYGDSEPFRFDQNAMSQAIPDLCALNVSRIILHTDELPPEDSRIVREALTRVLATPSHDDNRLVAWDFDPHTRCAQPPPG